jgi:hypothetical protein
MCFLRVRTLRSRINVHRVILHSSASSQPFAALQVRIFASLLACRLFRSALLRLFHLTAHSSHRFLLPLALLLLCSLLLRLQAASREKHVCRRVPRRGPQWLFDQRQWILLDRRYLPNWRSSGYYTLREYNLLFRSIIKALSCFGHCTWYTLNNPLWNRCCTRRIRRIRCIDAA